MPSDRSWLGHAPPTTQSRTYTFGGTWLQNDTITFTIDNIDLVITLGTLLTTTQVATTAQQAWQNTTLTDPAASSSPVVTGSGTTGGGQLIAQFAEITATTNGANVLTLTVSTTGRPATVTFTKSSAAGTLTAGTLNAATSSNSATNPDNWNVNGAPANGDSLTWSFGASSTSFDLDIGCQPTLIATFKSFTGDIGLPQQNTFSPSRPYAENRTTGVKLTDNSTTTEFRLGLGDGQGSHLQRFDSSTAASLWNVFGSGRSNDSAVPAILLVGTNAGNVLNNFNGDVGVGFYNEASAIATVRHGNGPSTQAKTRLGKNVTLTSSTIVVNGGTFRTNSALCTVAGSVTVLGGVHEHYAGNVKNLTINNQGKFSLKAGADLTITNLTVNSGGTLDLSNYRNALTISGVITVYKGAIINDPNGCLRLATAQIHIYGCKWKEVDFDLGTDFTLTLA
jgi:hypothetical protein